MELTTGMFWSFVHCQHVFGMDTDYLLHMVCRASRLAEITKANKRYSEQHLKNSSTRGVLAAAFTPEVADEYMTRVMFDSE